MKAARNMRPGLKGFLQRRRTNFAPSLGAELAGCVPFASGEEEGCYSLAT